jgi:hypothetical protein
MRTLLAALFATLLLAPVPTRASEAPLRCGTGVHAAEARGLVFTPQGDVFCPLVADPKAMRSFLAWQRGDFPRETGTRTVGAIGIADGFGLFRVGGPGRGEGLQLSLEAGVFAQFDLDARSDDLLNADYLVGLPLGFRRGAFSARLRVYHQSSHLGDELLARQAELVNEGLSFEALDLVLSADLGRLRLYAGGERLLRRTPRSLDPLVAHGGAELRLGPVRGARLVAAVDVKSSEQRAWTPAWSAKAGLEFAAGRDPEHPPRLWSVLGEYYAGPSPYGQFVLDDVRFAGVAFQFML